MSSPAEIVHARILQVEQDAQRIEPGAPGFGVTPHIRLTRQEIQDLANAMFPGVPIDAIREVGIVRIIHADDPNDGLVERTVPTKYINPANDLARYDTACRLAEKSGQAPPIPTAYQRKLIEARDRGEPLPQPESNVVPIRPVPPPVVEAPAAPLDFAAAVEQAKRELRAEMAAKRGKRGKPKVSARRKGRAKAKVRGGKVRSPAKRPGPRGKRKGR